jgi:hypothetical protein
MPLGSRQRGWRLASAALAATCLSPTASRAEDRQWHAVPVAGGLDALSAAAGIEPGLPGWRLLFEAARARHGLWGEHVGNQAASDPGARPAESASVPLPLAPSVWRRLLRRDGLPDDQLALAILADRRSSLLYRGLAGLDEPTLAALASDPDTLSLVHQCCADVLAAFGGRFRVRRGAVDVPGGEEAAPLWEGLVGASPREPLHFLLELLRRNGGRRAFLYDSAARLDPERQRFALALQLPAGKPRTDAMNELAAAFDAEIAWWRMEKGAFSRPAADAARLLREVRLAGDGTMAPPAAQVFWEAVFDGKALPRADWLEALRRSPPADAAWLAKRVATGDAATRRVRLEAVLFAQRVFGDVRANELSEVAFSVRSLRHTRALLLALERMGTRDPALYAAAASLARRAGAGTAEAASVHRTLQGALGLIDRARFARTLDLATAERLLRSLLTATDGTADPARSVAAWVEGTLLPELARAVYGAQPPGEPETTLLRAMAGDRAEGKETLAPFDWEGLWYRADPGRGEFLRLEGVRARQGSVPLAAALDACRAPAVKAPDPCASSLGAALTSLVYAAHLGDPEGPALAGADPSRRHDFGAEPWALPQEVIGEGTPWHVRGSLLGLEQALAQLSLHRLAGHELPDAPPVLDFRERRELAAAVGVSNPRDLADAERDALAAAVDAGRRRAAALRPGSPEVEAAGRDAGLDPWRVRALEWLLEHEPGAAGRFFSLGELLRLGAPSEERWDAWGVADDLVSGLRPRLPRPLPLDETSGREPEPALAGSFCDLTLRVAVHLAERRLPASLAPALVGTLLGDLFAEARPVALDDRLGLDTWVREQPLERLDDAVASLAGRGILQPAPAPGGAR